MFGKFCEIKPSRFCQERDGCDNCAIAHTCVRCGHTDLWEVQPGYRAHVDTLQPYCINADKCIGRWAEKVAQL